MRRLISIMLMLTLVMTFTVLVSEERALAKDEKSVDETWNPLRGKLMMGKPWRAVEKGEIFKSDSGYVLKTVTVDGTFKFDLKSKKAYKLTDDQWKEIDVKQMIQRNGGKIIVIKTSDFRIRMDLEDRYQPAAELLSGLTRM